MSNKHVTVHATENYGQCSGYYIEERDVCDDDDWKRLRAMCSGYSELHKERKGDVCL